MFYHACQNSGINRGCSISVSFVLLHNYLKFDLTETGCKNINWVELVGDYLFEATTNQPTNQPTKRLTKGAVGRRHETSSLARSNHSCVRNALLEMVNGALN
jgi:hypothetical protein